MISKILHIKTKEDIHAGVSGYKTKAQICESSSVIANGKTAGKLICSWFNDRICNVVHTQDIMSPEFIYSIHTQSCILKN